MVRVRSFLQTDHIVLKIALAHERVDMNQQVLSTTDARVMCQQLIVSQIGITPGCSSCVLLSVENAT